MERTWTWLENARILARDYERLPENHEGRSIEGIPTTPTRRPVVVENFLVKKAGQREKVTHPAGELCSTRTSVEEPRVSGEDDSSAPTASWQILSQLESLGIRQNPKLLTAMANPPEATLRNAIACLQEARCIGALKNPTGFLLKAIQEQWIPNEPQSRAAPPGFGEWFDLARELGLVIASEMVDGVLKVYTNSGKPEVWEEFATAFPLVELQRRVQLKREETTLERLPRPPSLNLSSIGRVSPDIMRQTLLLTAHSSINETREKLMPRLYEGVRGLANGSKRLRTTHLI